MERDTGLVRSERPFGDWIVNYLYCKKREQPPLIYQLLGSQWFSSLLGWINYDFPLGANASGINRFLRNCAVNLNECLERPEELDSARRVFERTTVLLFQEHRVQFSQDLICNLYRKDIESRYSERLGRPLVETDVQIRSTIESRKQKEDSHDHE